MHQPSPDLSLSLVGKLGRLNPTFLPPLLLWHHDGTLLNTTNRNGLIKSLGTLADLQEKPGHGHPAWHSFWRDAPTCPVAEPCFPPYHTRSTPGSCGVMCEHCCAPQSPCTTPGIYCPSQPSQARPLPPLLLALLFA